MRTAFINTIGINSIIRRVVNVEAVYSPNLTDGTETWRIGARDGELVWDYELTELGFKGIEDTDWYNPYSIEYPWGERMRVMSLFFSDGTTTDAGVTLVDKSPNGNDALLTSNLISNPGLEDDYLSLVTSGVAPVTNERSATQKHSGSYSRHISLSAGSSTGVATLPFSTKTGETVTFSFWVYGVAGSSTLRYNIRKGDASGYNIPQTNAVYSVGNWVQTTGSYVEAAGGNNALISVYITTGSKEFYIDDISAVSSEGNVAVIMPLNAQMASIDTSNIFYHTSGNSLTIRMKTREIPEGYNKSLFVYPNNNISFLESIPSNKDYYNFIKAFNFGIKFYNEIENVVTVGAGKDYDDLPTALAAITTANYLNRYRLDIYDDVVLTTQADFAIIEGSYHWYAIMKDYIYIKGIGTGKSITGSLPETATDDETTFYEPLSGNAFSGMMNMNISMRNGRYALHIDNSGNTNKRHSFFNCTFRHYCNQDVIDYRIAHAQSYSGVQTGNTAVGMGCRSGEIMYFQDCKIYGIDPIAWHTNVNFSVIAKLFLINCDSVALPIVQTNYNPLGEVKSNLLLASYSSRLENICNIYGGDFNSYVRYDALYYEPILTTLYLLKDIIANKFDNDATWLNIATIGGALKITSATSGAIDSVAGTGATALTSAICDYTSNYAIGRLEIGEEWEAYNANINIGTRLGNCSVVNKIITLNVDGVAKTITFNEDFSAKNNAYCLAFINTALAGSAVASLYQRASENELIILT